MLRCLLNMTARHFTKVLGLLLLTVVQSSACCVYVIIDDILPMPPPTRVYRQKSKVTKWLMAWVYALGNCVQEHVASPVERFILGLRTRKRTRKGHAHDSKW